MAFLWLSEKDQRIVDDFRQFVRTRLGFLGLAVLDSRLDGDDPHLLISEIGLRSPTAHVLKTLTRRVELLAVEYGLAKGDPKFLKRVEAALAQRRA